jgi:hypothetical protein
MEFNIDERSGVIAVIAGPKQEGCLVNTKIIACWHGNYDPVKEQWRIAPYIIKEAERLCAGLNAMNVTEEQAQIFIQTIEKRD